MSTYILEDQNEFERLEKQSNQEAYDFSRQLNEFKPKASGDFLDAGCGSGIVSRYLAKQYPHAEVLGCDFSGARVQQANLHPDKPKNLKFKIEDLTQLSFASSSFDTIICRYVLEHLSEESIKKSIGELTRCLRPGGKICVIDVDGFLFNLFPQTPLMQTVFSKIQTTPSIDLNIGRKIPSLLSQNHLIDISWKIETSTFQNESLHAEIELLKERFSQVNAFLYQLLQSETQVRQFIEDYFHCLQSPGAVLFYNMFIVTAQKSNFTLTRGKP